MREIDKKALNKYKFLAYLEAAQYLAEDSDFSVANKEQFRAIENCLIKIHKAISKSGMTEESGHDIIELYSELLSNSVAIGLPEAGCQTKK